jgi:AcrR family transcriptional regulator
MMADSKASVGKVRRSQQERIVETRLRLLKATVICLNKVGYSGTTIGLVSSEAKVTRGGLLHHFPSKVDLLIATAEHCVREMGQRSEPQGYIVSRPLLRQVMRSADGIALMEIMLGSRSDPELLVRFKPIGDRILQLQGRSAKALAELAGLTHDDDARALTWLSVGAIRGMMLMELAGMDPGLSDAALDFLERAQNLAFAETRAKEQASGTPSRTSSAN